MNKKQQTGLGRGLSTLIPKKDFSEQTTDFLLQIEIKEIRVSKYQPRENFDQQKLEELIVSIKEKGVIEPIIVVKLPKKGYRLICGERRLRASKAVGLKKIPAIVKKNVSEQEILQISLIENIQRNDLNVIERAKGIAKLIKEFGLSQEKAARLIGKQRSSVSHLIRLLTLSAEIQDLLKEEKISFGHAKVLLILTDKDKQLIICKKIIHQGLSVHASEELVNKIKYQKSNIKNTNKISKIKGKEIKNAEIKEAEEKLEKILGTKVRILIHKKGGKIEIEFYSLSDMERILEKIK